MVCSKNVHRVLHDEGRLAFACWQPLVKSPWIALQMQAVMPLIPEEQRPPPAEADAPGPFSFGEPDRVRQVLGDAGFKNIELEEYAPEVPLFGIKDMEELLDFAMQIGPARDFFEGMDDATKAKAREAVREAYGPYLTDEGVVMAAAAWIVTADKG